MLYTLFLIGALLLLVQLRMGFSDDGLPLFDLLGNKNGFAGLDVDVFPDLIGALLLLIVAWQLAKQNSHMRSARTLAAVTLVLSLLTLVQPSGFLIYEMAPNSYQWVFNPTVIADMLFDVIDTAVLFLTLVTVGTAMDGFLDLSQAAQHPRFSQSVTAANLFRGSVGVLVILQILSSILGRDSVSAQQLGQITPSVLLIVLRVIWWLAIAYTAVTVVAFVVNTRPVPQQAVTPNNKEELS